MLQNVRTRWHAFGVHLLLSSIIFISISALILTHWYPDYFRNFGGMRGIALIAGIDLVIGPLLTLVIYDRNKKHLKWDLVAIAFIQVAALLYGTWSIFQGRPIAQVLGPNGIKIITESDIRMYDLEPGLFGNEIPIKVYLDLPDNPSQIQQIIAMNMFVEERPIEFRTDLYLKFPINGPEEIAHLLPKKLVYETKDNCVTSNFYSRGGEGSACINLSSGDLLAIKHQ